MRKIISSTFKVISLQGYSQASRLVSKVLLTRMLAVHSFGILSLILLWAGILAPFLNFGTNKLITKVISSNHEQNGKSKGVILWSVLILMLLVGIVLLLIVVFPHSISTRLSITNWHLYVILLIATVLALLQCQFAILNGLSRPVEGRMPQHMIFPSLLILFLLFGYYTAFDYHLDWVIMGYSVIYGICLIVGVILIRQFFIRKMKGIKADFRDLKNWRNFSIFNFLTDNSRVYLSKLDLIFVGLLFTPESVALYVIPCNIFNTLTVVNHTFNLILEPKISYFHESGNINRLLPTLRSNMRLQLLLSLVLYAIIYFLGDYVLLLFGDEYVKVHLVLQITGLALIVQAIAGPAGVLLTMTGKVKERLYINLTSLVIASIVYPIVIYQENTLVGVAYAFVCTMLFSRILHVFMVNKLLKINLLKLMILSKKLMC